jgi:hypothetical protein
MELALASGLPSYEYVTEIIQPYIHTYIHAPCSFLFSFFLCLWFYSPILGLGRLHETFCFISVTRSRTVGSGRTPWAGDQLVARPLLTAPGDCDDGEVGALNGFGRGNRSTRKKPAPMPLCSPQIPLNQTIARTRAAVVGSQRLTASAMARPTPSSLRVHISFVTDSFLLSTTLNSFY